MYIFWKFQRDKSLLWWGRQECAILWADMATSCRYSSSSRKLRAQILNLKHEAERKSKGLQPPKSLSHSSMCLSARPYFLNLHKHCHQLRIKCSNTRTYGIHFSFKPPQTSKSCVSEDTENKSACSGFPLISHGAALSLLHRNKTPWWHGLISDTVLPWDIVQRWGVCSVSFWFLCRTSHLFRHCVDILLAEPVHVCKGGVHKACACVWSGMSTEFMHVCKGSVHRAMALPDPESPWPQTSEGHT